MANDYFTHSANRTTAGTTARASDINNIGDEIETGLDKLPTELELKEGKIQYVTATGVADAYVVTSTYPRTAYTDGMLIVFKVPAGAANTGACTVNVDGLGAKSIVRADSSTPSAGDLPAGGIAELRYDGTNFVMMQYPATDANNTAADAAAAAASAAAASTSETNAATSESNASGSASAASTSETNAAASAAAASTSETNAATSETNAAASAAAASTSESNASTSETNAATSASNAATSETNAAVSETNAANSYDEFDDRYLGDKAADPTLDNDGDPLLTGALYYNTVVPEMRVYNGASWDPLSTEALPRREHFTATAGQTTFTVAGGYTPDYIDVYLNGVKLKNVDDVTVTSGTDIVLISGATAGDDVSVVAYTTVSAISEFTYLDLAPATAPAHKEGRIAYDSDINGFIGYVDSTDVTLNIGEEQWVRGRNSTGSTITNGQVVYVSGTTGQRPDFSLAKADVALTAETIAIATHDITNNTEGFATTSGLIRDVDTSAWSDGDRVYLSDVTAGALTNVKPTTAGSYKVPVAHVLNSHATLGLLLAHIGPVVDYSDIASAGDVETAGSVVSNVHPTNKNVVIGGDFTTNPFQRGTSWPSAITTTFPADRFEWGRAGAGVVDITKTADAPTVAQAGVHTEHCLHIDVTTADASIAASDLYWVMHQLEGLNTVRFGFGEAGTRYVTLSFWHKHTKTGTYCAAIRNGDGTRSYIKEYTQSVSDTWEKAELTFPVATDGTWLHGSNAGILLTFTVAAGTTYHGASADSWLTTNSLATSNQVNAMDNAANNFKLALIQLEAGAVATTFESRDVGTELALCQRYYFQIETDSKFVGLGYAAATNRAYALVDFPVQMRTNATMGNSGATALMWSAASSYASTAIGTIGAGDSKSTVVYVDVSGTPLTALDGGGMHINGASAYLSFDAEL
jgi:hypothetical protein